MRYPSSTNMLFAVLLTFSLPGATPKLAIPEVGTTHLDNALAPALTEVLSTEFANLRRYEVITSADIVALIGFEAERQLLGCAEESCVAEIGGALGVDFLVIAQITKFPESYVVNAKLIDVDRVRIERRFSQTVSGSDDILVEAMRHAARALCSDVAIDTPNADPIETQKEDRFSFGVLPLTMWGVGAVGLGVGIAFGMQADNHLDNVNDPGLVGAQLESNRGRDAQMVANMSYGIGAAAILTGLAIWLFDDSDGDDTATVVSPTASGVVVRF